LALRLLRTSNIVLKNVSPLVVFAARCEMLANANPENFCYEQKQMSVLI